MTAWQVFFCSGWGLFEHRFGSLIASISKTSKLIDHETKAIDILQTEEWRKRELERSTRSERRWESEQTQAVLKWLEIGEANQELLLEWFMGHACEGTGHWITRNHQFRTWMGRGRGHPVLWMHGKPGSGE